MSHSACQLTCVAVMKSKGLSENLRKKVIEKTQRLKGTKMYSGICGQEAKGSWYHNKSQKDKVPKMTSTKFKLVR